MEALLQLQKQHLADLYRLASLHSELEQVALVVAVAATTFELAQVVAVRVVLLGLCWQSGTVVAAAQPA